MRRILSVLFILILISPAFADVATKNILIQEFDNAPSAGVVKKLEVSNGTLVNKGGGVWDLTIGSGSGSGTSDHAALSNLAYASAGHTGFQPTMSGADVLGLIDNTALNFGTGILTAAGFSGPLTGAVTGNADTASALAADPANCAAGQIALGVTAAGVAECTATPSGLTSVGATTFTGALTGNASTASALAADPADCGAGACATAIAASGALTCSITPLVSTSIDTSAELYGILTDETGSASGTPLAVFNQGPAIAGATLTGVLDAGGATSFEVPNSNDPDLTVTGQVSWDANGFVLRCFDGTNQVACGQKIKLIDFTVTNPDLLTETAFLPIWTNMTGMTFNIAAVYSVSDVDDAVYTLKYTTNSYQDHTNLTTIEAITISTNGTGIFYNDLTAGIDDTTVEDTKTIGYDAGATDCDFIHGVIVGWLDSNVN